MKTTKTAILDAYRAGLAAVDPEILTAAALRRLSITTPSVVIAIGKAAPAMTRGAAQALGDRLDRAIVVSDHEESLPRGSRLLVGDHPFPGEASRAAGAAVLAAARRVSADETLVALISGGGSSLAEVPLGDMTIHEVTAATRLAMNAGVPIDELNRIRRHLSALKNGRLLTAGTPRQAVTLALSDVVGGPASDIASGPTMVDASTAAQALSVLNTYGLAATVPEAVIRALQNPPPAPSSAPNHIVEVIGDGSQAAAAAADSLVASGYRCRIAPPLRGNAIEQARRLCTERSQAVTIAAGETTMEVTGSGRGGRNQAAALAAALVLDGQIGVFGGFATDGIDGPTDAAGAIVDGHTAGLIRSAQLDPQELLDNDDSYTALSGSDSLVITGPSGTNVADLWFSTALE